VLRQLAGTPLHKTLPLAGVWGGDNDFVVLSRAIVSPDQWQGRRRFVLPYGCGGISKQAGASSRPHCRLIPMTPKHKTPSRCCAVSHPPSSSSIFHEALRERR
jgi:hypothetical protein